MCKHCLHNSKQKKRSQSRLLKYTLFQKVALMFQCVQIISKCGQVCYLTKKFHRPSCSSVKQMKESNKKSSSESRDALIAAGYDPCKKCNPQKCVRYLKNMEEKGCSSILQYFFFAHIGFVVEGDCCMQKISCAGLR